jgi:hypothetical protein
VDSHSCIVAVVVPSPTDVSGWHAGLREATDVFDRAAGYADYSHLEEPVLNWGVEFGGPRGAVSFLFVKLSAAHQLKMPQNIKHNLPNCVEVALLMQSEGVQDIAGWQNSKSSANTIPYI